MATAPATPSPSPKVSHEARYQAAQRCTWVSIGVNFFLALAQVLAGLWARSQGLVADGLHSLSDLLSDVIVLFANRHGSREKDPSHPYGHARIETAATLALSLMLLLMGVGLLVAAVFKVQAGHPLPRVSPLALGVAALTLLAKESLFRYMMRIARQVRSQMLIANAWHARSDALSSVVVLLGIIGNLAGYPYLDLLAAALVAVLIIRMGWQLGYEAVAELVDTALDEAEVNAIRRTLMETPGVKSVHELRTRRMAARAMVDAHIQVAPLISVSEGHYIAELARRRVQELHEAEDVLVHIDPENDDEYILEMRLLSRAELLAVVNAALAPLAITPEQLVLHYLGGKIQADVFLPPAGQIDAGLLQAIPVRLQNLVETTPYLVNVRIFHRNAP